MVQYSTVRMYMYGHNSGFLRKNHAWLGPKSGTFSAATTGDESGTTPAAVLLLTIAVSLTMAAQAVGCLRMHAHRW